MLALLLAFACLSHKLPIHNGWRYIFASAYQRWRTWNGITKTNPSLNFSLFTYITTVFYAYVHEAMCRLLWLHFRQRNVLSGKKNYFLRMFIEFVWYNGLVGGSFRVCGCKYLLEFCLGGHLRVSRICWVFIRGGSTRILFL